MSGLPSATAALVGLGLVAAVLALALLRAHRSEDDVARGAVALAAVALLLALVVTIRLPVGGVGVPPHQVRYLWPLATFATGAAVLALAPRRWGAAALAAATVVLAVLTIPFHAVEAGPQADADAIPIAADLCSQLEPLEDEGTVVYDTSRLRFAEPWTSAVLACMQEQGIDFRVDDAVWARQLGSERADDGESDARVFVLEGDGALAAPEDDVRRVALVEALDMDEERELGALERSLDDLDIELNAAGRAAADRGALRSFADGTPTAAQLLSFGELAALVNDGLLAVPPDRAEDVARYAELRYRRDRLTIALFLDPTPYD